MSCSCSVANCSSFSLSSVCSPLPSLSPLPPAAAAAAGEETDDARFLAELLEGALAQLLPLELEPLEMEPFELLSLLELVAWLPVDTEVRLAAGLLRDPLE